MKVLHYFLGFPPYRTGGLTKYACDLMESQAEQGKQVAALWPGQMYLLYSKVFIKKRNNIGFIESYELINPLPIPLDEGINQITSYMKCSDKTVYEKFFAEMRPDVIHIHTLMGLHHEFIVAARRLGIRTVYTTHDYFGICPKVTLYHNGTACDQDHNCEDCIVCNRCALSVKKIWIMQSPIYRYLKDSFLVKLLRKHHRRAYFKEEKIPDISLKDEERLQYRQGYQQLRRYYLDMLSEIDMIHFNSTVSQEIYNRFMTPKNSRIISIMHKDVRDNRTVNNWEPGEFLKMAYLSPVRPAKGFFILKNVLDQIWNDGFQDFKLKIFAPVSVPSPYMVVKEAGFQYKQLKDIFADTDILIVPSIWYETFGFTVLEAVSYGVPVIVSDHVGAKDIIGGGGIVVEAGSEIALKEAITSLTWGKLAEMRKSIQTTTVIKTWEDFLRENDVLYY